MTGRHIILSLILILALTFQASAAPVQGLFSSNPIIIETNGGGLLGGLLGGILHIVSSLGGGALLDSIPGTNIYLLNLPNLPVVTPLLKFVLGIVFVEPDERVVTPARSQMGILAVPGQIAVDWYKRQPELVRIHATDAQAYAQGRGVVVADLNSLIDYAHPALVGHLTGGYDFVSARSGYQSVLDQASSSFLDQSSSSFLDQSSSSFLDQSSSSFLDQSNASFIDQSSSSFLDGNPAYAHATLCAGVIAAVAPDSMIMPLRVFDNSGQTDVFSVTKAIYYAVGHGARVINMSFGMSQSYNSINTALSYAASHGVVVIASAGNQNTSTPQFPASVSGVIGVASVSSTDAKASFSDYGTTVYVDAPGINIISAYPGARYAMVSGTSFSAPMVAGEAALIMSVKTVNVKTAIGSAAVNINALNPSYVGKLGVGRIDIVNAVK
jgi:subtilisin family serine protease